MMKFKTVQQEPQLAIRQKSNFLSEYFENFFITPYFLQLYLKD
jgi:hypothetical protein